VHVRVPRCHHLSALSLAFPLRARAQRVAQRRPLRPECRVPRERQICINQFSHNESLFTLPTRNVCTHMRQDMVAQIWKMVLPHTYTITHTVHNIQ